MLKKPAIHTEAEGGSQEPAKLVLQTQYEPNEKAVSLVSTAALQIPSIKLQNGADSDDGDSKITLATAAPVV